MPPEILALIDKPVYLIGLLFVGAVIGINIEKFTSWQKREAWKARKKARGEWVESGRGRLRVVPRHDPAGPVSRMPDAAEQLRTVMGASFKPKKFLNRGETRVFTALEPILAEVAPGWRVMAQVSLGEVLDADSVDAFNTINAKRVDFLLLDPQMRPRHAIEYQGQGHHQGPAAARDAVKKEALRRAGIGFVEVLHGDTPSDLRRVVERLVRT
jgi:hypothetical protein